MRPVERFAGANPAQELALRNAVVLASCAARPNVLCISGFWSEAMSDQKTQEATQMARAR